MRITNVVMTALVSCALIICDGGTYETISGSDMCEISSPVFYDAPSQNGIVPAVEFRERMGFFVDTVIVTNGVVTATWKTDANPPYDVVYGFDSVNNDKAHPLSMTTVQDKSVRLNVPNSAKLLHIQVGESGCVQNESERLMNERIRAFTIQNIVTSEYYYHVLLRKYSPYKGASYVYPSDSGDHDTDNAFRTIVFTNGSAFQYQFAVMTDDGMHVIDSHVFEDKDPGQTAYGVGYRIVCYPDSEILVQRAFSAHSNRSDAKIVRLSR